MNMDDNFIFEDEQDILEIIDFGFPRRVHDRKKHFEDMDDLTFFKRFRFYKETVINILEQVEDLLEFPDDRNRSISPINQLLCCLRFYATGGHLSSIADFMGMDVATVSRIVAKVSGVIARLGRNYIKMPQPEQITSEQNKFCQIAQFSRVVGVVDGTHIKIQSPGGDKAEVFRNRKRFFSLNVQVLGSADLKIQNVVARWPGSAHYSTIFGNSTIRARFDGGEFPNCLLLGDSGYSLRPYFLTPLENPQTRGQRNYNRSHIRTRNSIERLIGVWKRRFPVMAYGIRLKFETVMALIVATVVLHNIARNMNEPEPPVPADIAEELNNLIEQQQILPEIPQRHHNQINLVQNELIQNYFLYLR